MTDSSPRVDFAALVEDRPERDLFRVDRAVYLDPTVFDAEIAQCFEGGWVYLAHESQIKNPNDYFTTRIGRQPVVLVRKKDASIACYINACAHRGATLVPFEQGKANVFACRYHGWVYDHDGKCIAIKNEDAGGYAGTDIAARFALTPVARLDTYRGFIFASLNADVPALGDWLAGTTTWIDLLVDQSPQGLEVLRGASTYMTRGNWKLQVENGVDGYHVSTVHRVYALTVANREATTKAAGLQRTESGRMVGNVKSGCYDFGNGHMAVWAQHTDPASRPLWQQKDRLEREFPKERVDWMLNRGRNLYLFPNMFLMDNPSTQVRTLQPISADLCEVTVRCIAPVGESASARTARLRKFEDFYLTTGMATSDDLAALEATQDGNQGRAARWNAFVRGTTALRPGIEDEDGAAIGLTSQAMTPNWDHDQIYHGFYRHWHRRLMATDNS